MHDGQADSAASRRVLSGIMSYTKEQIIVDISVYIRQEGGPKSDWYIGVASGPRDRLFNDHNVNEKRGAWIYRQATSSSVAREVERAYLEGGYDGGAGGGDADTDYVYAYRKTSGTNP